MMRHHPISPITEQMQYRAIGIVRGNYSPGKEDDLTSGVMHTKDGTQIEAVILGKLLNLVRHHLELENIYLWIAYPRCREPNKLHLQMVGVWEPKHPVQLDNVRLTHSISDNLLPEGEDYFSVRGELIYTYPEKSVFVIQIRQIPRKNRPFLVPFRLQIDGKVSMALLHHFLALDLRRQGQKLSLDRYVVIGSLEK